jgi:SnoaL-like domain
MPHFAEPDLSELRELLDREKIRYCLANLARGEDRRNAELIAESFWPEASVDFGTFCGAFPEYLAWVVPGSPAVKVTQHVLGQSLIQLWVDTALVETHVTAYHRLVTDAGDRDAMIGGRYLDSMEKRGSAWRIAQRTMLYDWHRDLGSSADWSQGVMGAPLGAGHYCGRAAGDHSETMFGEQWPMVERR